MGTQESVIEKINKNASLINEEDLDSLSEELVSHYRDKIRNLAYQTYVKSGSNFNELCRKNFTEQSKLELKKGLYTYLFKSRHYLTGRDINTYLLTCLNRLSYRELISLKGIKKVVKPVCPACKVYGSREFLVKENKDLFRCENCFSEMSKIDELLKDEDLDKSNKNFLNEKKVVHQIFSIHSKQGVRCPDCERFIPSSHEGSCAYADCGWFGNLDNLDLVSHPQSYCNRNFIDIDDVKPDQILTKSYIDTDTFSLFKETYEQEVSIIKSVIEDQMMAAKRGQSGVRLKQRLLMYQAYANMLEARPCDMVAYLAHMKNTSGSPIQSCIFQEYVKLVENSLPLTIRKKGKDVDIYSLQDPDLNLFLGVSEFTAVVDMNHCVNNNTKEEYIGGKNMKNYGPCFIGLLIDVKTSEGESLMDYVEGYTFIKIMMNKKIAPGTSVNVEHFRTYSHYEMGELVNLQKTRRKIVDSVYRRLHGKRRLASDA